MAYSGLWKRTQTLQEPDAEPLGHPEYGRYHLRPGRDERIGARPPYAAPRSRVQTPPGITDDGRAYDSVLPADAPPGLVDQEPITHDAELGPAGAGRSYRGNRDAGNAARSRDRNAGRARLLRRQELDEGTRETERLEVLPSQDAGRVRAFRGDNSLPDNNPDGDGAGGPVRNGLRVRRWYHRRIPQSGSHWSHELRTIRVRLAESAGQRPPLEVGNRYSSPYAQIVNAKRRTQQGPMVRRSPRPWDETAATDGSEEADYSASGQGLTGWGL